VLNLFSNKYWKAAHWSGAMLLTLFMPEIKFNEVKIIIAFELFAGWFHFNNISFFESIYQKFIEKALEGKNF
jgi:hypothetical protein